MPRKPRAKRPAAPKEPASPATAPEDPPAFLIAGIGASAGGIEALGQVLDGFTEQAPLALVIVQHRSPSAGKDLLPEILRRHTTWPVDAVADGMPLEPGRVYVAPPLTLLGVGEGRLVIVGQQQRRDMPIDFFLRSLAAAAGPRAAAVLLSGSNTDGTLGSKDIREQGGLVLAQSPETTEFSAMPQGVIQAGLADQVLAPGRMAEALVAFSQELGRHPATIPGGEFPETERDKLLVLLKRATGHGFTSYKASTIGRRIARRMILHRLVRPADYVELVRHDAAEAKALFQDLLIGVTRFFRDPEAFAALATLLAERVLPATKSEAFRAWVAGCATGEEAYSVAMTIREAMDSAGVRLDLVVYATDLDANAVAFARQGLYPPNIAADISPERLARFFTQEEAGYRLRKEIREAVVFAVQNLIQDPPFSRLDLVCCRNLLMYLRPEAQESVLRQLGFGLKPGGLLMLGSAEGVRPLEQTFEELHRAARIFRRTHEDKPPGAPAVPRLNLPQYAKLPAEARRETHRQLGQERRGVKGVAERFLLEACVPPSVLVDRYGSIRYFHGRTGQFLEPASGEPVANVVGMARPGLDHHLTIALGEAVAKHAEVVRRGIAVRTNGHTQHVDLQIRPVDAAQIDGPCFMVSFVAVGLPVAPSAAPEPPADATSGADPCDETLGLLQAENERLREDLRGLVQEYETANEELQSMNEELQSANEELQSTNEELETGKEELQAMNEEQASLNAELACKVEDLSHIQDDMDNLLAATDVATLFLDMRLAIRRFTPAMQGVMDLLTTDIGRPVGSLALRLAYTQLEADAAEVLRTLNTCHREVQGTEEAWWQIRILPYRTRDNVIDGVVVTLHEVTRLKRSEQAARAAQVMAEGVVNTILQPLLVLDQELRVESANPAFYQAFQVQRRTTEGTNLYALGDGQWDIPALRELLEEVIPQRGEVRGFILENTFPRIGRLRMQVSARRIETEDVAPRLLLAIDVLEKVAEPEGMPTGSSREEAGA